MISGFHPPVSCLPVSFPPSLRLASLVLLFSFAFSLFSVNYGQVKIKEKVEIKPSTYVGKFKEANQITEINHTMRFELTWPPNSNGSYSEAEFSLGYTRNFWLDDSYDTYYYDCGLYTSEERTQGDGYLTITYYDVKPSEYGFNYSVGHPLEQEITEQIVCKIYWDDVYFGVLQGGELPENTYWQFYFVPPSYNNFYMQKTNPLALTLGGSTGFSFEPEYAPYCDEPDEYPDWNVLTDDVQLTIMQGSEYITLYDENNLNRGSNLSITLNKVEDYDHEEYPPEYVKYTIDDYIKYYNGVQGSQPYLAEVKVEANGVEETVQIELLPCTESTLAIVAEDNLRNYIHHGLKSTLPIKVEGWCNINSIENVTFTAEITQGAEYGVLINPAVNPEIGNLKLTNITHSGGKFELVYYAKGTDPYQDENVTVKITPSNPDIAPLDINLTLEPMDLVVKFAKTPIVLGEEPNFTNQIAAGDTLEVLVYTRGLNSAGDQQLSDDHVYKYIDISGHLPFEFVDDREYSYVRGIDVSNEAGVFKEGVWIKDIKKPIQLVAKQNVDLDSVGIRVYVWTQIDGASSSSSIAGMPNTGKDGITDYGIKSTKAVEGNNNYKQNQNMQLNKKFAYKNRKRNKSAMPQIKDKDGNVLKGVRPKIIYNLHNNSASPEHFRGYAGAGKLANNKPNGNTKNKPNPPNPSMSGTNSTAAVNADLWGMGVIDLMGEVTDSIEILLGETKYFGVKKKGDKYKIAEIETSYGDEPTWPTLSDGWEWVKDGTVWSDRPIDVTTKGTSPIFYDKFFGVNSTTGTTRPVIKDLEEGMLRIIGRYWEAENEEDFRVKLKTTSVTNAEIEIKVIKPNKLGDENPTVVGPNNNTWNLDSLIIETAGKTGILPQIIKGIIEKESVGFHPSYRYEPFADMYNSGIRSIFDSTHTYWIGSETDLGTPTIPQHQNLRLGNRDEIDGYPGYQTVWDYYSEYDSSLFTTNFYPYQQKMYNGFYKEKIDSIKKANKIDSTTAAPIAEPLTVTRYQYYLKYEIGKKGMLNTIAQTRIAASYGLMQLTYYSGVNGFKNSLTIYNYPNNDENYLPESINIPDINIEWGTKHLLGKLRKKEVLGSLKYLEEDTWPKNKAFEKMYWEALYRYNGKVDYPNKVLGFANNYFPEK